jgi:hypothetical protein
MPDVFLPVASDIFPWLWGMAILALVVLAAIQAYYGRRLKTSEAPGRIVSLELAGTKDRTQRILDSWDRVPGARADAIQGLCWDFGFLAAYAIVLSHGCAWAGRAASGAWGWPAAKKAGDVIAWLVWLAAFCDAGENLCLLRQLKTSARPILARASRILAVVKFALIVLELATVAVGLTAAWPYLGAHVQFAAAHPGLVLVLAVLYGMVYGLIGTENGIPALFWHDRFRARLAASCGATLLLLELGVIVYDQDRDDRQGLVATVTRELPCNSPEPAAVDNVAHLSCFLVRGGVPMLLLLAAPAIIPSLFPNVPKTPMKRGGLGFDVSSRMRERAEQWGREDGRNLERAFQAAPGSCRWLPARLWGSLTWLLGMALGIGVLVMLAALAVDLNAWSLDRSNGGTWWISPSLLFLAALVVLFGWANNSPYKLRFPNMEAYDPEPAITRWPVLDPLCRAALRWLGDDPAARTRVPLRKVVAKQYLSPGGPPDMTADGAKLIEDETALAAWLTRVQQRDGKLPRLAVVVASGGATRSAYWTATVLERIEEVLPEFSRHVRVIAGASGGMLGIGCYIKELRARLGTAAAPQHRAFPHTVPPDSIQKVARFIALQEVWRSLFPFRWHMDRGVVLEDDWGLGIPIQDLRAQEERGEIPSVIFSPMIVDDGRRLLVSNLDLWQISGAQGGMLVENDAGTRSHDYSLSALEFFRLFPLATGFRLATAIRMNASFPYVSPAVNLPCDPPRRVVDAGYYDNYGVQVASAWIRKNLDWLLHNTSGVVLVQLRAAISQKARLEVADAPTGIGATMSRGFQFFSSPLTAVAQAWYTVSAFTNDQDVQNLSDLFTDRFLRVRTGIDPTAATAAQRAEARAFFTTTVFENSAVVSFGAQPADYWPGDAPSGSIPSTEVALDWYLSDAEREGMDTAIPRLPGLETVEAITGATAAAPAPPPPGSNWTVPANRLARINWLVAQVAATHGVERDIWLKELEQARNFERLVQLRQWWRR